MFLWFSCAKQSSIQLEPSNSNLALSWKSNSVPVLLDESCNLPLLFKPSMVQRLVFSAKPSYRLEIPLGYYKKKSCPDHLLQLAFTTVPIYCCVWALSKAKKKKIPSEDEDFYGLSWTSRPDKLRKYILQKPKYSGYSNAAKACLERRYNVLFAVKLILLKASSINPSSRGEEIDK